MFRDIRESDWKIFRQLKDIALDRFCTRVLSEVGQLIADPGKTHHERYGAVYGLIHRRDRELAATFDGMARSTALIQLARMCSDGLLTDEEMARFSPEARESIKLLVERW